MSNDSKSQGSALDRYFDEVGRQLGEVRQTQGGALRQGASWIAQALQAGRWLFAFGTGHSHMLAEEIFFRAGGLVRAVPILDPPLMLHESASGSSAVERREGYAAELIARYGITAGDVLIVGSNSGRNAVPIEMAMVSKEKGARVIAVTNGRHASAFPSRHSSGRKLSDVADLIIDNCGRAGDAFLELDGMAQTVGATSTITGVAIIQGLIVEAVEIAIRSGFTPEVYVSSNSDGERHNEAIFRKYRGQIRHL